MYQERLVQRASLNLIQDQLLPIWPALELSILSCSSKHCRFYREHHWASYLLTQALLVHSESSTFLLTTFQKSWSQSTLHRHNNLISFIFYSTTLCSTGARGTELSPSAFLTFCSLLVRVHIHTILSYSMQGRHMKVVGVMKFE